MAEQQLTLDIAPEVKVKLTELGYHPEFGARPLSRVIQEQLEDQIADFILDNTEDKQLEAILAEDKIIVQAKEIA